MPFGRVETTISCTVKVCLLLAKGFDTLKGQKRGTQAAYTSHPTVHIQWTKQLMHAVL